MPCEAYRENKVMLDFHWAQDLNSSNDTTTPCLSWRRLTSWSGENRRRTCPAFDFWPYHPHLAVWSSIIDMAIAGVCSLLIRFIRMMTDRRGKEAVAVMVGLGEFNAKGGLAGQPKNGLHQIQRRVANKCLSPHCC